MRSSTGGGRDDCSGQLEAGGHPRGLGVDKEAGLNRSYREFVRYYGFKVDPTPPRAPKKKGKVESSVKYVKRNALAGRHGEDFTHVNAELLRWVEAIAGVRVHGTTGQKPLEVVRAEEREQLQELPQKPYELVEWKEAKVHPEYVNFDRRLYSVPWTLIGQQVWARATPTTGAVYADEERVATHSRPWTDEDEHERLAPAGAPARPAASKPNVREERAAQIGPETAGLVQEIFDCDDVLSQLRRVQSVVTHLEGFPTKRAEAASRCARFYGTSRTAGQVDPVQGARLRAASGAGACTVRRWSASIRAEYGRADQAEAGGAR